MKRLNPETGEPFRYGDVRLDGKVFRQYQKTTDKSGFFHERWVHPDTNRRYVQAANLRRSYGISIEDRDRLLAAQGHRCWICERPESVTGTLCVDHCHDSLEVRGLLCVSCNVSLGHLQKAGDPEQLGRRMVEYLNQRPAQMHLMCGES
jgi:hypothetical protein